MIESIGIEFRRKNPRSRRRSIEPSEEDTKDEEENEDPDERQEQDGDEDGGDNEDGVQGFNDSEGEVASEDASTHWITTPNISIDRPI